MPIYLDVSAAVHRRAGLGRYAESLARALVAEMPDDLALFYNRERGIVSPDWIAGAAAAHRLSRIQALAHGCVGGPGGPASLQRTAARCHPVPRDRAPSDAAQGHSYRDDGPRPDLPPSPGAPQAAQPLVPQCDHAALLQARRCRHRRVRRDPSGPHRGLWRASREGHGGG